MLYTLVLLALAAACPYCNARVADPEPFIAILILILFCATSVSALALQATVSLTLMFPAVPEPPLLLWIDTLPEPSEVDSCAPVSSPPVGAMLKSVGSISQEPVRPCAAAVVILAEFATSTCAAEVSMKPPLAPLGALASSV